MKIITIIIILLFTIPTLSLSASQRCADNFNEGLSLFKEGNNLYDAGNEDLQDFYDLYRETTETFHLNRLFNRPQQENSTDSIITAIKLHDVGLKKTKEAKTKFERSIPYFKRAKKYCDDDDYDDAKRLYKKANTAISDVNESLFGSGEGVTLEYADAKFELLASLIRITITDTAIYVIENKNIDLNHIPKVNRPLLIIAAENGATEIARALIINGADIDIKNKNGYSAIEIAAISGDDQLFTSLFKQKASTFQLSGFNKIPKYKTCNLADMVQLSSYSEELREYLSGANKNTGHTTILEFLKAKGLTPVCNLNPLLAKVNDKKIHQNDVDLVFAVKVIPEYSKQNPGQEMPANQKIQYKKDIIIYLVNQLLQAELALNLGIVADQKIVDEYATGIHNQTNNVKVEQVKSYVRNEILVKMIVKQEVIDNITITDNELKTFYANNPDKFSQSESIHVRHISMADKNKLAEVLLLARKDGRDFAELAVEYSEGPSNVKGGDLGFVQRGQLVKPFEDSAFVLNEGEISDIIETQFGFHIIELIERKAGGVIPFGKVKDQLHEWIKAQKVAGEVDKWTEALRADASIEIL